MTERPIMWVLNSSTLLDAMYRAHKGDDPKDIIIDLWNQRDPKVTNLILQGTEAR